MSASLKAHLPALKKAAKLDLKTLTESQLEWLEDRAQQFMAAIEAERCRRDDIESVELAARRGAQVDWHIEAADLGLDPVKPILWGAMPVFQNGDTGSEFVGSGFSSTPDEAFAEAHAWIEAHPIPMPGL
jgi:hypothetical protein